MSKTFGLVAAAALLASVTAFAQTETPATTASPSATAPAASSDTATTDTSTSTDETKKPRAHHHHMARNGSKPGENPSTDNDANKLNACDAYANPTSSQENCLQSAERS